MLNRSVRPTHTVPSSIPLTRVNTSILSNGIPLHILSMGHVPALKIEISFPSGGSLYEKHAAQAFMTLIMLAKGTKSYNSSTIAQQIAYYGAFLESNPSFDNGNLTLFCLNKHLEKLLPLLIDIITYPTFSEDQFEQLKINQLAQLEIQLQKNNVQASKLFRQTLYGGHPYGKIIEPEDFRSLQSTDLGNFFDSYMKNIEVFVSGSIDSGTTNLITYHFSQLEVSGEERIRHRFEPVQVTEQIISNANSVQSSVKIGKRIIGKTHQDYHKFAISNHILGGYFGSRLMKKIREKLALTYGIGSSIVSFDQDTYIVVSTDIKMGSQEQARNAILDEITNLIHLGISEAELKTVKSHLIGSFQSSTASPFSVMDKFKAIHSKRLDYNFYDNYFFTLQTVTTEDIGNTFVKYFQPDSLSTVIIS